MSFGSSELSEQSPFVIRAELALKALKDGVNAHIARETHVRRVYSEWQQGLLLRTDRLRQQIAELEARLAPWMPRGESLRLAVVSRTEENA